MYHRLRSAAVIAHHFKINESNIRTIIKKKNEKRKKEEEREIHKVIVAARSAVAKTLLFLRNIEYCTFF